MAMAAVALCGVYRYLSPVRHALVWSAAFATAALQWGVIAGRNVAGDLPLQAGLVADLLGLTSMLLFAEGFRLRYRADHRRWVVPLAGATGAALLAASALAGAAPWRGAVTPGISALLLGWAATLVVPPRQRASAAEWAVVGMLVSLTLIGAGLALAALGEQSGLLQMHRLYLVLAIATVEPACAAIALFTLLLIAFDFSADLRRLVHTDPLTGVLNRLGFEHALNTCECNRRQRSRPLLLAIADIDFFKEINDRHGHAAGDATLACFADHLAKQVGRDVHVARIGGEEFALLLPGIDGGDAFDRIDPLRKSLASLKVDQHPHLTLTASFGVAERHPGEAIGALLERADAALYRSKRAGRNRSTLAQTPPAP